MSKELPRVIVVAVCACSTWIPISAEAGVADGNHNTGAEDTLIAATPPTSEYGRIWVQLSRDVSLATLAQDLKLDSGTLAQMNELLPSAKLKKGAWLLLPQSSKASVSRSDFIEPSLPDTPISSATAKSCPANIGDYGWTDGRGGDLGESLIALAPGCGCKLNKQWIKEWFYANGRPSEYKNWLKNCNR